MKKLVVLAAAAILAIGAIAVAAVLLADDGPGTGGPGNAPQTAQVAVAGSAGALPGGPTGPTGPAGTTGYPPGPRRVQLPPGRVKSALSEPLSECFRTQTMGHGVPAVLVLDLEAQASGGFAVLDANVKTWGAASAGLVDCARRTLRGQVVPGGSFTPGDRATTEFVLDPPASIVPPAPEPPPSTLPATRQQPNPRRSGGSR